MKRICLATLMGCLLTVLIVNPVYAGEIHDAIMAKDIAKVRQLLDCGANVNVLGEYKRTPLHFAAALSILI